MNTIKCYHGTTKKGLRAILSGECLKPNCPWTVSEEDGAMYVWPSDKLDSCQGLEGDAEEINYYGISQAFESAECQAVTSEDTLLYTLVLNIPKDLLNDDHSCDNMCDIASFIACDSFDISFIESILESKLNIWRKPYIAMGLINNPYFNKWALDEDLLEMAKALQDSSVELEPLDHHEEFLDVTEEYIN